jgi:hypothetical protein
MTSINDRDAGRDAESYDDDRKEGRYAAGGDRAHWFPVEPCAVALSPSQQAVLQEVEAQLERAFGKWDRATGRHIPHTAKTDWLAIAADITGAAQ